jgi:N4-gp56 family major capsid protein
MAVNLIASSDNKTNKLWMLKNEQLFRDSAKESFFSRFEGGKDSIVYVKNELEKTKGDQITVGMRPRLTGAGVPAGSTLLGNEEALTIYDFPLTMEGRRHGVEVPVDGTLSQQRIQTDLGEEAMAGLKDWIVEYKDAQMFAALRANPTTVFHQNNGAFETGVYATIKADIVEAQDKITPNFIRRMKTWALTGGNRSQTPLRPIKVDGRNAYVLLVPPDVAADLKENSVYEAYVREAADRGRSNPLFTGAVAVIDNVVIHEHENVHIGTDGGGAAVPFAEIHLLGAQSLCWAWGKRTGIQTEVKDYNTKVGYGVNLNYAVGKPVFNSLDYGSIMGLVSRTQTSDVA